MQVGPKMHLERLVEYDLARLGMGDDALDGPFVMEDGAFGLLVSLRGKDGGALASTSELRWPRDVPPRMREAEARVFVRRGPRALYLGLARVTGRGKPARDGFKVAFGLAEPLDEATFRAIVAGANAPPRPAPEEAIAALEVPGTTEARVAAMRVFLERWFDCTGGAPVPSIAPAPLRELHRLTAGRDLCAQNRLVAPGELELRDGKIVFYVENQGVCVWAVDAEGDDPAVYRRASEANAPWLLETWQLSSFLIELLVYEAVLGAPFSAGHDGVDVRALAKVARVVAPLPLPTWRASGVIFYGHGGVIGFAFPNGDVFEVRLGARERTRFEPLERIVADWTDIGF
jgi:hypothetical protein